MHRRHFNIIESDEAAGVILASITKGFLKAGVDIELHIHGESEEQATLNIQSKLKKAWLTPDGYNESVEDKFINTLCS